MSQTRCVTRAAFRTRTIFCTINRIAPPFHHLLRDAEHGNNVTTAESKEGLTGFGIQTEVHLDLHVKVRTKQGWHILYLRAAEK